MAKFKKSKNSKQHPKISSAKSVFIKNGYKNDGALKFEDFLELSQGDCYYCGAPPMCKLNRFKADHKASNYAIANGTFTYNGVDRLDNSLPHNKDNCVPCCWNCNRAKSAMSIKEFKNFIRRIYKNFIEK